MEGTKQRGTEPVLEAKRVLPGGISFIHSAGGSGHPHPLPHYTSTPTWWRWLPRTAAALPCVWTLSRPDRKNTVAVSGMQSALEGKKSYFFQSTGPSVNLILFRATRGDVTLTAKMLAAHTFPPTFPRCHLPDVWGLAETLSGSREGAGLRRSRGWLFSHSWRSTNAVGCSEGPRPPSPPSAPRQTPSERPYSDYGAAPHRPRVSCGRHLSAFLTWSLRSRGLCPSQSHLHFGSGTGSSQLLPGPRSVPHLSLLLPPVSAFRTFPFPSLVFLSLLSFTPPKELS